LGVIWVTTERLLRHGDAVVSLEGDIVHGQCRCRWPAKHNARVVGNYLFCGRETDGRLYCDRHQAQASGKRGAATSVVPNLPNVRLQIPSRAGQAEAITWTRGHLSAAIPITMRTS
jgi:hypothetical protein